MGSLEGALVGDTQVLGLLGGEGGEAGAELLQVETGNLLIELLGQEVHSDGVLVGLGPQGNLGQHLAIPTINPKQKKIKE